LFAYPSQVLISLAATGCFLTIISASALRFPARHPEVKELPVELPTGRVPVGIVSLKNRTLSPVAQLFIQQAREVAKPLVRQK
jgi:DNA-binding transcriptional LysR family regulator